MHDYDQTAKIFKAFCDEARLRILTLIRSADEICACVLLEDLSISQSTLSHHMKILVESGLVHSRKDGKRTMYSLSGEGIETAKKMLNEVLGNGDRN